MMAASAAVTEAMGGMARGRSKTDASIVIGGDPCAPLA